MALFDFLKKKKDIEKAKKSDLKPLAAKKEEKQKKKEKAEPVLINKKGFSYEVIKNPHLSEKANNLSAKINQYVFRVYDDSNKIEIKKAVEGLYRVNVLSVNLIRIPRKKRRLGRIEGFKKGYKKAIVKIKEGQKIEII